MSTQPNDRSPRIIAIPHATRGDEGTGPNPECAREPVRPAAADLAAGHEVAP